MPEDLKHRILRNCKCAQVVENDSSNRDTGAVNVAASVFTNPHIAAAAIDLPFEININTDPTIRESIFGTLSVPYSPPSPVADRSPTPTSPTLIASTLSIAGTPEKKKKKKKKQTSTSSIQVALEKMTLNDIEEGEYSM
jgi:hypothetical protein